MDVLLKSDHDTKKYREPHSNWPRKQQGKERTRFYSFNVFRGFGMEISDRSVQEKSTNAFN